MAGRKSSCRSSVALVVAGDAAVRGVHGEVASMATLGWLNTARGSTAAYASACATTGALAFRWLAGPGPGPGGEGVMRTTSTRVLSLGRPRLDGSWLAYTGSTAAAVAVARRGTRSSTPVAPSDWTAAACVATAVAVVSSAAIVAVAPSSSLSSSLLVGGRDTYSTPTRWSLSSLSSFWSSVDVVGKRPRLTSTSRSPPCTWWPLGAAKWSRKCSAHTRPCWRPGTSHVQLPMSPSPSRSGSSLTTRNVSTIGSCCCVLLGSWNSKRSCQTGSTPPSTWGLVARRWPLPPPLLNSTSTIGSCASVALAFMADRNWWPRTISSDSTSSASIAWLLVDAGGRGDGTKWISNCTWAASAPPAP